MSKHIDKIQNKQYYSEYNFIKMAGYSSNKIIELINDLDIFDDKNYLTNIDKFISELYHDIKFLCPNYKFVEFINKLFTQNNNPITISYNYIFNELFCITSYSNNIDNYINFFELNDEQFKQIITKYSNIKLTDKLMPLDPKTKITLSDKNFNLSNIILNKLTNNKKKIYNVLTQSKLELIIKFADKNNSYLKNLLYNFDDFTTFDDNYNNDDGDDDGDDDDNNNSKSSKIYDELINKTEIDFVNDIKNLKHLSFVVIKLLILNNAFDNFISILDILYSRSNIPVISMISILRFELLDINLTLLTKIVYYGRYDVFKLLFFHIPYKILLILKESNPLDFRNTYIDYTDDIYGGSHWGNDEHERIIVGKKNHAKLIKLILSIGREKNYLHICWTDEIKKHWVDIVIENEKNSHTYLDNEYFVSYNKLIKILELKFDFTNKESIKEYMNLFGRENTWNIIKTTCNDKFLDLLFD